MPYVKIIKAPNPHSLREGESFKVGDVLEYDENDCTRWIRRGVALPAEQPSGRHLPKPKAEPAKPE